MDSSSVSRGLARQVKEYKGLLMAAAQERWNDLDGRGNLTARGWLVVYSFFVLLGLFLSFT